MATIAQLKKKAHTAINALNEAQDIVDAKRNKKLVGRCFKYSNSGGGCDERWWLYAKVIGVDGGRLQVLTFERLPNGSINIEPSQGASAGRFLGTGGYIEISHNEIEIQWQTLMAHLAGFQI